MEDIDIIYFLISALILSLMGVDTLSEKGIYSPQVRLVTCIWDILVTNLISGHSGMGLCELITIPLICITPTGIVKVWVANSKK